jgi:hypothetical protein
VKPNKRFLNLPKAFWANVRTISQAVGYTERGKDRIKVPTCEEIQDAYGALGLRTDHIFTKRGALKRLGKLLLAYFAHRAKALDEQVEPALMNAKEARAEFLKLKKQLKPKCPLPMNKQKKAKRAPAYLTGIVNMLVETNAGGLACDYDPKALTTTTRDGMPLRTLARRVDGAFPSTVDPVAVWEIKEYYYTTTFGSRVADGIYETLLDGMEIEEMLNTEGVDVKHYLIVDARYTWWECGRSYLCRIVDMLHMGYLDEALFGREVITRLPTLIRQWRRLAGRRT